MRRTRSRHVGRSVLSGATTPNRNGLVMPGLLSEGQMSGRLPRAPGGFIDVESLTAPGALRSDQGDRNVSACVREQPHPPADDRAFLAAYGPHYVLAVAGRASAPR